MYSEKFKELVNKAFASSLKFYEIDNVNKPNPYYIGFGNPNAQILIVGQEKSIDKNNIDQITSESAKNPFHWKELIDNKISDINHKFPSNYYFKNPLHPYDGKPTKGNTWNYYQRLIDMKFPDLQSERINNSFLLRTFITEINHQVSPKSLGNQKNPERIELMSCGFYNSFPITIMAIGNYLSVAEVKERFDVKFVKDDSEPQKKLIIYSNDSKNRILIHTRQFSQFFFNDMKLDEYFNKIIGYTNNYGC